MRTVLGTGDNHDQIISIFALVEGFTVVFIEKFILVHLNSVK